MTWYNAIHLCKNNPFIDMRKEKTILFTLDTLAKEEYNELTTPVFTDRKVHIVWDAYYNSGGPILKIENTPGSWYLSTLLGTRYGSDNTKEGAALHIHGRYQICLNISDLLKEAVDKLEKRSIIVIPDNK